MNEHVITIRNLYDGLIREILVTTNPKYAYKMYSGYIREMENSKNDFYNRIVVQWVVKISNRSDYMGCC